MRGLFLDFLFPAGHKNFSGSIINILSNFSSLKVYAHEDYYGDATCFSNNVEFIYNKKFKVNPGMFRSRLSSFKIMLKSIRLLNREKPDYCIVTSFDTIVFALGYLLIKDKQRLFLIHHNNVDEMSNKIKQTIFKLYMNKVNHIVFEEFIKEHLVKITGVDPKKVFTIPHSIDSEFSGTISDLYYDYCGLSNSNDEQIICTIIDEEKKNQNLKNNKIKIILKSKTSEYDNGYLKVFKGFLSKDEYNEIIERSRSIILPFPQSYQYRISGVLIEAISGRKHAIGSNIPLFRFYNGMYPSLCDVFIDYNDLINKIRQDKKNDENEYQDFIRHHSNDYIANEFLNIING